MIFTITRLMNINGENGYNEHFCPKALLLHSPDNDNQLFNEKFLVCFFFSRKILKMKSILKQECGDCENKIGKNMLLLLLINVAP